MGARSRLAGRRLSRFVHRPELADAWDLSIWLDGAERVGSDRINRGLANYPADSASKLIHLAQWWARIERYVIGQRIYVDLVCPQALANIVVDNNDLGAPKILSERLVT